MHFILCDAIDSGKSTFCMRLVKRLTEAGHAVSGWVTPAHLVGGDKQGHDFVAIDSSRLEPAIPFTRLEPFAGSFRWHRYHFNPQAFERASKLSAGKRIFIMDEIGPLELDCLKGFYAPMSRALDEASITLSVIRSGLEDRFIALRKGSRFITCSMTTASELESAILNQSACLPSKNTF